MTKQTFLSIISITILTFCIPLASAEGSELPMPLVPYPQEVLVSEGSFTPSKQLFLSHDGSHGELADTCVKDLSAMGFIASHGSSDAKVSGSMIKLNLVKNQQLGKEGYQLKIDSGVSISAATSEGLFWGTRTLLQLLHAGPEQAIPQLTISDQPEFPYRALMIDNARSFHSIDFHLKTIKRMASYKLNRYQIHFSDDQSYTLPSAAFPNLPTKDRHFTPEEIAKLMEVCRRYHVMLVPEIDVPGHARALIQGIPSLGCGGGGGKLCIGKEQTYQTLEKLFTEVMEMMPGGYWHLGADEVHYQGTKCVDCVARMKKEKLENGDQLFNYFINRMHGFIKNNHRQMLVWEGFSPTLAPEIHKDIIVCPFDIKHKGKMPADYFNAGYKVLNTSWTPLYVADKLYMTAPEIIARWSPYMFGAGRSPQPFAYWKKFNPEEYQGKVLGGQVCSWATEEKAEEGLLFGTGPGFPEYGRPGKRVQIVAERLWTGSKTSAKDLLERVGESYWPAEAKPKK
jgi:N-acetyl-beta-hexosaminidase